MGTYKFKMPARNVTLNVTFSRQADNSYRIVSPATSSNNLVYFMGDVMNDAGEYAEFIADVEIDVEGSNVKSVTWTWGDSLDDVNTAVIVHGGGYPRVEGGFNGDSTFYLKCQITFNDGSTVTPNGYIKVDIDGIDANTGTVATNNATYTLTDAYNGDAVTSGSLDLY